MQYTKNTTFHCNKVIEIMVKRAIMKIVEEITSIFLNEVSLKAVMARKNHLKRDNKTTPEFGIRSEISCKGRIFCVVKNKKRRNKGKESTISKTHP